MLILNHEGDALFDTTNAIIRITYSETSKKYVVLGINNGYGAIVLSSHDSKEDAKKAILLIHLAAGAGLSVWDFDEDMSKMDDAIKGLRSVATKKTFKVFRGE